MPLYGVPTLHPPPVGNVEEEAFLIKKAATCPGPETRSTRCSASTLLGLRIRARPTLDLAALTLLHSTHTRGLPTFFPCTAVLPSTLTGECDVDSTETGAAVLDTSRCFFGPSLRRIHFVAAPSTAALRPSWWLCGKHTYSAHRTPSEVAVVIQLCQRGSVEFGEPCRLRLGLHGSWCDFIPLVDP